MSAYEERAQLAENKLSLIKMATGKLVRYDLCGDDIAPFMVECSEGEYVKHEDVKAFIEGEE